MRTGQANAMGGIEGEGRRPQIRRVLPASLLLLLAGACGSGGPAAHNAAPAPVDDTQAPSNDTAAAPPRAKDAAPEIPGDADLTGLSPAQRRAYEQGYRDCNAGRYVPDRYPEAYRIGCAAAHDRQQGARPQG